MICAIEKESLCSLRYSWWSLLLLLLHKMCSVPVEVCETWSQFAGGPVDGMDIVHISFHDCL
jgi:hypothetical protein